MPADRLGTNLRILRASSTPLPRIWSTTKRTFRGDNRTNFVTARASIILAVNSYGLRLVSRLGSLRRISFRPWVPAQRRAWVPNPAAPHPAQSDHPEPDHPVPRHRWSL